MHIFLKAFLILAIFTTVELNAQNNSRALLIGIIESYNQQYQDLENFISSNAICLVDGSRSDSSALIVLNKNSRFLHTVYKQPKITIQHLVADNTMAMAEWIFTDSIDEISRGMVAIHLTNNKIHQIKIYNGKTIDRSGKVDDDKKMGLRRTGSRSQRQPEEQSWWYYLRHSQGGFADPAGLYVSQIFPCDSPKIVKEAFEPTHLKGPFNSRQAAGQDRQSSLSLFKNLDIEIITRDANCDN
ncbi:MAG: hypothetical protein RLO17_17665 [Cyclobacteriaceae bacterium]|jgi:hypothetical protein